MTSTRVVLVCPNDMVIDTRGQKMAMSLHRLGYDVVVVARATDRAPDGEFLGEVEVIRVPVPAVSMERRPPHRSPTESEQWAQRAAASKRSADAARRGLHAPGARMRRKVKLTAQIAAATMRSNSESRRSRRLAREESSKDQQRLGSAQDRRPWPTWREDLHLPLEIDKAFWPVIRELNPDVVHSHDLDGLAAAGLAHQRLRAEGRDVRLVYDAHENWAGLPDIDWRPEVHAPMLGLEAEFITVADAVSTVSEEIAQTLQARYSLPREPTVVLNTPLLRPRNPQALTVRAAAGLSPDVPVMVYSGTISHARRVPDLIRVLPLVPDVHLVVVSVPFPHRMQPEFLALADELGVADRVHVIAPVDNTEVIDYLSGGTFGVHPLLPGAPNHEMALPNKLFEYLHAGLPVIVSNCAAMSRFVTEHDVGRVFTFGDLDSLAQAIRDTLVDPDEGQQRRAALAKEFCWQAEEPTIATLYDQAIHGLEIP